MNIPQQQQLNLESVEREEQQLDMERVGSEEDLVTSIQLQFSCFTPHQLQQALDQARREIQQDLGRHHCIMTATVLQNICCYNAEINLL